MLRNLEYTVILPNEAIPHETIPNDVQDTSRVLVFAAVETISLPMLPYRPMFLSLFSSGKRSRLPLIYVAVYIFFLRLPHGLA